MDTCKKHHLRTARRRQIWLVIIALGLSMVLYLFAKKASQNVESGELKMKQIGTFPCGEIMCPIMVREKDTSD